MNENIEIERKTRIRQEDDGQLVICKKNKTIVDGTEITEEIETPISVGDNYY